MRYFIWKLLETFFFPLLSMSVLLAKRVKVSSLLVNRVKELAVPNVNERQVSMLYHTEESALTYSIVGKIHQKNPSPSALKGAQASVDILGATLAKKCGLHWSL